jgi:hypothetical protein
MAGLDNDNGDPYAFTPSAGASVANAPSADINVAPGFTPDYDALLGNSPVLAAAKSASVSNQQAADAARRASVRSKYVQYGGDIPTGWTDKYGDLDQATQDAAQGNQFSTIANLRRNYEQSVESFKRGLAARGMLQSGELNYGQDQLDRGLGQQRYDAGNSFLNAVGGDYGTYAGVLGQNARDLASAVGTAEGNVLANPANRPVAPTKAHYDTSLSAKYGKPVYTDDWGTVYDQFGNVLQAGTPPPPPPPPPSGGGAGGDQGGTPTDTTGNALDAAASQVASTYDYTLPGQLGPVAYRPGAPAQPPPSALAPTRSLQSVRTVQYDPNAPYYGAPPVSGYSARSKANVH